MLNNAVIPLQALDLADVWTWLIISVIIALVAAAFGIYNAQRGMLPNQRHALDDLQKQIDKHQSTIGMLQEQATSLWTQAMENKSEVAKLRAENVTLKLLTQQQAVTIQALQMQLTGLASGNRRTGRRLREVLTARLNEDELREWAADLNIPFDSLSGKTLPALIISMLDTLERYGRLEDGLSELQARRPDIPWGDIT